MIEFVYWAMVAAFTTHELDAVRRHEWRMFPGLSRCPETLAAGVFVWLHAPLLLVIFWFSKGGASTPFSMGLSLFAIAHVLLHLSFRKHPRNEFNTVGSWALIVLTGLLGALHLLLHSG